MDDIMEKQEPPPAVVSSSETCNSPSCFQDLDSKYLLFPSSTMTPPRYFSDHIDWFGLLSGQGQPSNGQQTGVGLGGGGSSSSSSSTNSSLPTTSTIIKNNTTYSSSSTTSYGYGGGRGGSADEIIDHNANSNVIRRRKAARPSRVAFQTRTDEDILDDGYRWRKYGQKSVKNSLYPRSYYRCTHHTCNVKKQVQRLSKDTGVVVTTYEGKHNHPYEKLMETLSPLLQQMQFLASRF